MLQLKLELPRKNFVISVDLHVQAGTILCLFGPSATGKSSILSTIAGFEKNYTNAHLSIDGQTLVDSNAKPAVWCPPWRRHIGYMEQSPRLFPHLNVQQNIFYGVSKDGDAEWIHRIIEAVGIKDVLTMRPKQLSGGMAQRVALARALAVRPRLLLLDEPFSALDWAARRALQDLVIDVQQQFSMTLILVTHQLTEAQKMANRIALIDQGVILQTGSPSELMEQPVSWQAAQLLGYTAAVQGDNGKPFFIHPDQVVLGEHPHMGVPVQGIVTDVTWYEGRRRVRVALTPPWTASQDPEIHLSSTDELQRHQSITFTVRHARN